MLIEKNLVFRNPDSWDILKDGDPVLGVHIWGEEETKFDCDVTRKGTKEGFFLREETGELSRPTWFMRG